MKTLFLCVVVGFLAVSVVHHHGASSQRLFFNDFEIKTSCSGSFKQGSDQMVMAGFVGPNFTSWVQRGFFPSVTVQYLSPDPSSIYQDYCVILIGTNGALCSQDSLDACYCKTLDPVTGQATIVVNYTAQVNQSRAVIRGVWPNNNSSASVYSDDQIALPPIYDPEKATLTLTVNNQTIDTNNSRPCSFNLIARQPNPLRLCCADTATPCYPQLLVNGTVVAGNLTHCANYNLTATPGPYPLNVTLTYTVCSRHDFITRASCLVQVNSAEPELPSKRVQEERGRFVQHFRVFSPSFLRMGHKRQKI